jgi:hypothetical protein
VEYLWPEPLKWIEAILVLSSVLPLWTERVTKKTTQEILLLDKGNITELQGSPGKSHLSDMTGVCHLHTEVEQKPWVGTGHEHGLSILSTSGTGHNCKVDHSLQ